MAQGILRQETFYVTLLHKFLDFLFICKILTWDWVFQNRIIILALNRQLHKFLDFLSIYKILTWDWVFQNSVIILALKRQLHTFVPQKESKLLWHKKNDVLLEETGRKSQILCAGYSADIRKNG